MQLNNTETTLLCFHWNSGYGNAPQCYIICAVPILFITTEELK
jgi:hypothetical protein